MKLWTFFNSAEKIDKLIREYDKENIKKLVHMI